MDFDIKFSKLSDASMNGSHLCIIRKNICQNLFWTFVSKSYTPVIWYNKVLLKVSVYCISLCNMTDRTVKSLRKWAIEYIVRSDLYVYIYRRDRSNISFGHISSMYMQLTDWIYRLVKSLLYLYVIDRSNISYGQISMYISM